MRSEFDSRAINVKIQLPHVDQIHRIIRITSTKPFRWHWVDRPVLACCPSLRHLVLTMLGFTMVGDHERMSACIEAASLAIATPTSFCKLK
jgi:hypothetical protein